MFSCAATTESRASSSFIAFIIVSWGGGDEKGWQAIEHSTNVADARTDTTNV